MIKDAENAGRIAYKRIQNYRLARWESRIKYPTWMEQEAYMEGWFQAREDAKRTHNGKQLQLFDE